MDLGDLCICGHTREVHFGGQCSIIGENTAMYRHLKDQLDAEAVRELDCDCKQFVVMDLGVEIFEALKTIALSSSVCHECKQKVAIARAMIAKAEQS